jgi:hypothetical protein
MKVWVIMSNDYPESVFSNEEKAGAYVKEKNDKDKEKHPYRLIFWRSYEFDVRD